MQIISMVYNESTFCTYLSESNGKINQNLCISRPHTHIYIFILTFPKICFRVFPHILVQIEQCKCNYNLYVVNIIVWYYIHGSIRCILYSTIFSLIRKTIIIEVVYAYFNVAHGFLCTIYVEVRCMLSNPWSNHIQVKKYYSNFRCISKYEVIFFPS